MSRALLSSCSGLEETGCSGRSCGEAAVSRAAEEGRGKTTEEPMYIKPQSLEHTAEA